MFCGTSASSFDRRVDGNRRRAKIASCCPRMDASQSGSASAPSTPFRDGVRRRSSLMVGSNTRVLRPRHSAEPPRCRDEPSSVSLSWLEIDGMLRTPNAPQGISAFSRVPEAERRGARCCLFDRTHARCRLLGATSAPFRWDTRRWFLGPSLLAPPGAATRPSTFQRAVLDMCRAGVRNGGSRADSRSRWTLPASSWRSPRDGRTRRHAVSDAPCL